MPEPLLECQYYQANLCRSCTLLEISQDVQLKRKCAQAASRINAGQWLPPCESVRENFRNKVKLVVTGSASNPKLGILGDGDGVDLRHCPLPTTGIQLVLDTIAAFISDCNLEPYDPRTNRGVLKYVILTESPAGELMVRFVVRRRGVQGILFKKYERLQAGAPNIKVISMNVQPEHKAIVEGEEEIFITDQETLPMVLDIGTSFEPRNLHLLLRPQSFFQTNTDAASQLYRQCAAWAAGARTAWDLYCGVGGFALALAQAGVEHVIGIEASEQAILAARESAKNMGVRADFVVADATSWAIEHEPPELLVVNPPRRGIGQKLASWINTSGVNSIVYSSCNIDSLARDLHAMENYRVVEAQVVDMFAHTKHFETIVFLERNK